MGLHRNLIHPRFGSHILLGTVITSASITRGLPVLDEKPCIDCKLCVAACPVGAIEPEGAFRFSACYDHNYREFMTGFSDFVEAIADSPNKESLRHMQNLSDQARTWQSLAFKPVYNAAYCLAVCPAGDDVIGPFAADRAAFVADVLKPLQAQNEQVYAVKGSDAEAWVRKRFPHKRLRLVSSSLRPVSVEGFFSGSALTFQRGQARGWRGVFHFDFDPAAGNTARRQATFVVDDGELVVSPGLVGEADVVIAVDGDTWVGWWPKRRTRCGRLFAAL